MDGPAEHLGKDARIVIEIDRFRPGQIVDMSDMRCRVVKDHRHRARDVDRRDRRATGDFDLRTFAIRAYPVEKMPELRPGMSASLDWRARE
jgi:hypothetical protein